MFQGHGSVDLELRLEQSAWLSFTCAEDNSILVLDCTVRIAHHWNTEYCISAANSVVKGTSTEELTTLEYKSADTDRVVPFSPVVTCAMNLCDSNFDILASRLPRHLRVHVDTVMR